MARSGWWCGGRLVALLATACAPQLPQTDEPPSDSAGWSTTITGTAAPPDTSAAAPDTGRRATSSAALALGAPTLWSEPDWPRPQHHAQITFDRTGERLYVGYTEGPYSGTPTARTSTVDVASGVAGEHRRLGDEAHPFGQKPAIAVDGKGRVVTAWQGDGGGVYLERWTPGVDAPERVVVQERDLGYGEGNHSVDLVLRSDDSLLLAWYAEYPMPITEAAMVTCEVAADLSVGALVVVDTYPHVGSLTPDLALVDDERALLVYPRFTDAGGEARMVGLDRSGLPEWWTVLAPVGMARPALDVEGDRVAVTWPQLEGDVQRVVVGVTDPSAEPRVPFGQPFEALPDQQMSTLAFVGEDVVLVAYSGPEFSDEGVWVSLVSAVDGAVLRAPERLTAVGTYAMRPAIAVYPLDASTARVALSWEQGPEGGLRQVQGVFGEVRLF